MTTAPGVSLPVVRDARTPYSIAFVCLGNICRSPTAAVVMAEKLAATGVDREVVVRSAGTGTWHIGEAMDRRAAATLVAQGYDPSRHRAVLFDASWFEQHDVVLVMDQANLRDVRGMTRDRADQDRVIMFRAFDPAADEMLDVPDPWFGGDDTFDEVLAIVERTCDAIVAALLEQRPWLGDRAPSRQHLDGA
jgi:protein-tyrosine phosphatase